MSIGTRLFTWLRGEAVGADSLGNRYYRLRGGGSRRWVLYRGEPEASSVPPEWNAWLHHTVAEVPDAAHARPRPAWEKPHQPNLTGTSAAYRPPGAVEQGGRRAPATGDYEAWAPE